MFGLIPWQSKQDWVCIEFSLVQDGQFHVDWMDIVDANGIFGIRLLVKFVGCNPIELLVGFDLALVDDAKKRKSFIKGKLTRAKSHT